jgi:hypothetical protein
MFGVTDAYCGVHQQSPIARNLQNGDRVILVCQGFTAEADINVRGVVQVVVA